MRVSAAIRERQSRGEHVTFSEKVKSVKSHRRPKIDWSTIEAEYVGSEVSLNSLSLKYGVNYPAIWKYSTANKWKEKRQVKLDARVTAIVAVAEETQVQALAVIRQEFREAVQVRVGAHRAFGTLFRVCQAMLQGPDGRLNPNRYTPRQLRDLAETMKLTYEQEMLSAGHPLGVLDQVQEFMVAGLTVEDMKNMSDDQLNTILNAAVKAKDDANERHTPAPIEVTATRTADEG